MKIKKKIIVKNEKICKFIKKKKKICKFIKKKEILYKEKYQKLKKKITTN